MCHPKNENERSTEGQATKNTESADTLKRQLSELYADEGCLGCQSCQHCEKGQPEDTSHFVSSASSGKKRETATEEHNPEEIHQSANAHEKEDNGIHQNGQTLNPEKTNTKKHKSSTDEPPNRRGKKKRKKKFYDNEVTKPSKQMIRINYLLQASFLMNEFNPNISREYIKTMRKLSNKFLIKYDRKFKKLFCKKCNSVLIPSATCKVSVNPLNLRKKKKKKKKEEVSSNLKGKVRDEFLVSYRCNYCQHDTKLVYENGLTAQRANEAEAV
ncbi:ribonuclease P protein subunit RPR2 [Plasmodium inui San Antonio 1]|uniref:Ribonuclease P protein subunit RPR2 n=1 Tax=Plasmodium inui San Antonio 1 TaxID=1237626 RepID=W7A7K1_9APIC|nr:ribonuclease P protein subunit RPR2 [Plasmodium inui San Antonio 1]EUD67585.1 ribonuclease P protein subunit RPR2 [Plasmodium inui San Antonio 1]